jgi:hypothetical protein
MRWIAGLLIILFVAGCTEHDKTPSGIIPKDKMQKIFWDMVQADRFVNTYIMTQRDTLPVKKEKAAEFYEKVFRLHGITREEFIKSYKYYLGRPDLTRLMFDSIAAKAERRRPEVYNSFKKSGLLSKRDSLMRRDSIRKADSIVKAEESKPSTEELFADSVIKRKRK